MPHVPKRPPALAHLSDEAAARALAKHFGDFVKAAKDLEVGRSDLRKLSWHNPRILNAAHERLAVFHDRVRAKAIEALHSGNGQRQRWGAEVLLDSYEFRGHSFCNARWCLSAPPASVGSASGVRAEQPDIAKAAAAEKARQLLEQETAAERAREAEADRQREFELERAREAEASREREGVVARRREREIAARAPATGSLWPTGIRRPSRGGYR